ncbi:DUF2442 domain-containing protein [Geomonas sp. Red69]|uniref:DUF2442 domain-containing protein n=1 Tax=Geomonas diazotrophica TaxID=2843197 RepID=UPI001C10A94A|nr:DUF2442 domain-containing protein [Geomonas diazotrophica]MBU5635787.1 DUF2442 domain-containing protein [Geomonas diazotrophica]
MTYGRHGKDISDVGVTNVSTHGFWLLVHERELFLPFEKFPWFKDASIGRLVNVKLLSSEHLYWPDLDVDLELQSILHPDRFPLVSTTIDDQASTAKP